MATSGNNTARRRPKVIHLYNTNSSPLWSLKPLEAENFWFDNYGRLLVKYLGRYYELRNVVAIIVLHQQDGPSGLLFIGRHGEVNWKEGESNA